MVARRAADIRLRWACYAMCALAAATAYSQARVQLINRGEIIAKAQDSSRFWFERRELAKRGRVLAADGRALAQDDESRVLRIDFRKVPHSSGFFVDLSAATGIPATEFSSLALRGVRSREWKEPISADRARLIKSVKQRWRADGVSLAASGRRFYPLGVAAASVVGLFKDGQAISGIERGQDKWLAGQDGRIAGLVDRGGSFLPMRLDPDSEGRQDGVDVQLTIDADLQQAAAKQISGAVKENRAERGVAVVMNPRTGDVLALATWPTFDPNVEGGKGPGMTTSTDFNPATMSRLEPGSTFKILTLAKALDTGAVSETSTVDCRGQMSVGKRVIRCDMHAGTRAHGVVGITDAIAKSCNVSAATWARKVGYQQFASYIADAGLLERPGTGLPGEVSGSYNRTEPAKQLQLATMGFGQSITTTPLSLAAAFSSLANGGKCMFPRLITRIGERVYPPEFAAQVVSPKAAQTVLRTMEAVIESEHGTGHGLAIPGYRLAGKTGTAQRVGAGRSGYVSSFVGYVPARDPKAVVLVMVDNPRGGKYYGASVAGPVFVELARAIIRRYDLPPDYAHAGGQR